MMANTNLDMDEVYMGFITSGICRECGKDTFAADEVCFECKVRFSEEDRLYAETLKSALGIDCE